jgi:hypothetical protein
MTRTNGTTENGDGVVVAPAKKSLVHIGKYQILGPLGKGNFARVEEAIHTVLGVKVSVINSNCRRERRRAASRSLSRTRAARARNSVRAGTKAENASPARVPARERLRKLRRLAGPA